MIKELIGINKLNKKKFKNKKEYYDFLMYQIQSHMVEIDELKTNEDPHLIKEAADIALLSHILAINEGADEKTFKERINKIKEKIIKK